MPLLYKTNKPNMKPIAELDQSEALFIIMVQPMYSFSNEQAQRMIQIVRDYYDPNQSGCASCGGIRGAKDSIIKLYQENTELINNISQGVQPVVSTTKKKKK